MRKDKDNPMTQALARISAGKSKGKKAIAVDDTQAQQQQQAMIGEFLMKMDDTAKRDRITHRNKKPAVEKLTMLPKVLAMMKNKHYQVVVKTEQPPLIKCNK